MRILFVASSVPVPPTNGQAIRTLSMLRALACRGHDVTFVSFTATLSSDRPEPLSSYCSAIDLMEVQCGNLSQQSDYFGRLRSLLRFQSYSVERFRSSVMRAKIDEHLREAPFDLIFSDNLYVTSNIPETSVPILLNCHNVEYLILQRYADMERNPLKRLYAMQESARLRAAEKQACERARAAIACSEIDLGILKTLCPSLRVFVVPNVVDTDSLLPEKNGTQDPNEPVLLYQGGMDWYPNRDAVAYFAHSILPLIRMEIPSARFLVAGRNPPPRFVEELGNAGAVEFTGTFADIRPYFKEAGVVVVPLRVGGGTRIKILEAAAAGKPIVSTTLGAEGLDLHNGEEIILADEPAEFAQAVITLLKNPSLQRELTESARRTVVERYSHRILQKILDDALEEAFHDPRPTLHATVSR